MAPDDPASDVTSPTTSDPAGTRSAGAVHASTVPARAERAGWPLLAIVALVTVMLGVVVVQADIANIADPGWRDNALWAAGAALVLLGFALGAVAWTVATEDAGSTLPRVAVLAAVIGGIGAVLVVGLADEKGGEVASSSATAAPAPSPSPARSVREPEPPLGLNDALNFENLTAVALPVTERTLVTLELTPAGNQLIAGAMGCRPQDLRDNEVLGTAVGGTWVQPLVVVGPPVMEDGSVVARCGRATVRLPLDAGVALPRL